MPTYDDDPDFLEEDEEEEELDEEMEEELEEESEIEEDLDTKEESSLETISPSEIPIKIHLEVSRFSISLEELSRLEPGYKLPININPRIVHLTSSGKVIGKGEMMEIGETVGVRIIELY